MLIFTIILAGIGLVTLYGYPMLMQQQTNADEKIMEKNMIVLQNDIKSLAYKTVPYKETSLKIGGGTLFVYSHRQQPDIAQYHISALIAWTVLTPTIRSRRITVRIRQCPDRYLTPEWCRYHTSPEPVRDRACLPNHAGSLIPTETKNHDGYQSYQDHQR